jgi:hypothetical protein
MGEKERVGKSCRIILIGDFHYSGTILSEDEYFITIQDKFNKQVSLQKSRIEAMEVSND